MVDIQIINNCKKGHRTAYEQLYNQCIPYVYATIQRYISHTEDRKDIIQESFAKVFNNIERYNAGIGSWNTWLRKIVVNECLMHLRKHRNLSTIIPLDERLDTPIDDDLHLDQLSRDDIDRMLSKMPEGYKLVFMMYVIDGYDHKEISEALRVSNETSRSQLNRAKKWLKNQITNDVNYKAYGLL